MLSYVQLKILSNALKGNSLRYSDLKPSDIDQDLFNYHLRFLLDKKYLKKEVDFYQLTNYGKKYVIQMDTKGEYKPLFRVSVIAIAFKNNRKEILMEKRLRHPYYGDTLLGIAGKLNQGELVIDGAKRKFLEETGLNGEFEFIGVIRKIRKDSRGNLIEDSLYHVCVCENPSGDLSKANDFGFHFWYDFELSKIEDVIKENITYDENELKLMNRLLNPSKEFFYLEEFQTLKSY